MDQPIQNVGLRRALRLLIAVLLLTLLMPAASQAADLNLAITEFDIERFPDASAIVQVGGDAALKGDFDPAALEVLVDGKPIANAKAEATRTEPIPSTTVLLLDESGSMKGAALAATADAARRFVQSMRSVDRVGLYTFDEEFRVLAEPTSDPQALLAALDTLKARKETALYDAVNKSLSALGGSTGGGSRYLVVLSDGGDTASRGTLEETLAQARAGNVQIYTVGLMGTEFDARPLQQLAEATGGRYLEAPNPEALGGLYASLAREIQNQFRLTFKLDPAATGSGNLVVQTTSAGATVEAARGFFYPAPPPTTAPVVPPVEEVAATPVYVPPLEQDGWVAAFIGWGGSDYTVAILLFVLCLMVGYLVLGALMPKRDVLAEYSDVLENRRRLGPRAAGEDLSRRPGEAFAQKLLDLRGYNDPLQQRIEAAGWQVRTSEFVLFHIVALVIMIALVLSLGLPGLIAVMLSVIVGLAPLVFLDYKARKRRDAFEGQVPDTLLMMASSFRAGQSFEQAMQVVASEGPEPTATEFSRVLAQQRLGVTPEVALRTLADRMQSEAFDWVVMVTIIQRQVGGNLAEVYEKIAHTLRERVKLGRLVKTLTAEGRLSAIILIGLPFAVGALIFLMNGEYLEPLWTTLAGYVMVGVAAAGMLVGVVWMRRIIRLGV